MATHSSVLAWEIPQTEEPGRMQSMGLQRVGHDWATNTLLEWGHGSPQDASWCCGSVELDLSCTVPHCWRALEELWGSACGPLCKVTWASNKNPLGGLPWWFDGYEFACQCRGNRLNPCSGKIPHAWRQLCPCTTSTEPSLKRRCQWEAHTPQLECSLHSQLEKARPAAARPVQPR